MVSERQFMRSATGFFRDHADGSAATAGAWARIIGLLAIVLVAGESAFGELLVQPMVVRRSVLPGRAITVGLSLQNMDPKMDELVTLTLKELSQSRNASWVELDPTDPNLGQYPLRSCRSWVTIPPDPIAVGAYKITPFSIRIDVPAGTRGFYFASVVAATAPREVTDDTGVVTPMNFEMIVPIILEVQGIPMTHQVSLTEVALEYQAATTDEPAANFAVVDITNAGGTFSTIMPVVRVWGQQGGHSRKVAEFKMDELGILPGVKLQLRRDLGRLLAPGPYKIEGFLYVDSKRGNMVQKQIMFTGDPRIADTPGLFNASPLDIQPADTFLEVVPGATRSGSIQVTNGSEEGVTVRAELLVPPDMVGKSSGRGVRGDHLGCTDWVTVEPATLTMRGYSRANLRIIARMPKGTAQYPWYYGTLRLHASYRDGKPAGTTVTHICIGNKQVPPVPLVGTPVLTISETAPSRYLVVAGYMNAGETYVTPSCRAVLSAPTPGTPTFKQFLLSSENFGQKGILLPFETRSFSGVLDLSDVPAGTYFLTSVLRWSEKWPGTPPNGVQEQRAIIVTDQGGRKFARLTENAQPVVIPMQ